MINEQTAVWIWAAGLIAWGIIRFPHMQRARKHAVANHKRSRQERFLLALAAIGLSIVPLIWVATGFPAFAGYTFVPALAWIGTAILIASLALFHIVHTQLGKNWSVTLEIRADHKLQTQGLYGWVRHPMYSSFFLWALAQAFLLPNLVAGLAGLAGVGLLYALRVGKEEAMLIEAFGDDYRAYMKTTRRIIPGIL